MKNRGVYTLNNTKGSANKFLAEKRYVVNKAETQQF